MLYTSTRDKSIKVSAAQAIAQGISEEGGLFVPCELPHFSIDKIVSMTAMSYIERAKTVLKEFLTDFTDEELDYCVSGAYAAEKFSSPAIAKTVNINGNENILELWHGPTCAFKDMALQLLPYLMTVSAHKTADGKTIVILVSRRRSSRFPPSQRRKRCCARRVRLRTPNALFSSTIRRRCALRM